jgi:kynurenine formamidase
MSAWEYENLNARMNSVETYIDLSVPIIDGLSVYPGDELPRLIKVRTLASDGFNNFNLSASMHIGTHIDGPMHLTQSARFLSDVPITQFVGPGCILDVSGQHSIRYKPEYGQIIQPGSILILYTGMGLRFGTKEYFEEFPVVSIELARLFVERRPKMVCMDSPSPDRAPHEIHKLLLENNILIAENLIQCERLLPVRTFEIIALPLHIQADSSPARIIARIREEGEEK